MRKHVVRRAGCAAATGAATLALLAPAGSAAVDEPSTAPTSAENQPPVAAPDFAAVPAGATVTIAVLANDTDDGLGRDEGTPPGLEVVGVTGDARVSFTATDVQFASRPGDSGTVEFEYRVSDGELEAIGEVTVTVTPAARRTVTLRAPRRLVALRDQRLTGSASHPGQDPVVRVQRRIGGQGWKLFARPQVGPDGSFAVPVSARRLATWRLRAVASWSGGQRANSPVLERRVVARLDAELSGPLARGDVPYSYRTGCPVAPARLRRLTVSHLTYGGAVRRGSIVISAGAASTVRVAMGRALSSGFALRRLRPADHFYDEGRRTPTQSDLAAMRADNTSAFNCRSVTGNPYRLSQHSYGNAIDINTVRNPYVTASRVYPPSGRPYLNRRNRRAGMLYRGDPVVSAFRARGWLWGGRWAHPDYQHLSANGR
jgi:hypothetical protein